MSNCDEFYRFCACNHSVEGNINSVDGVTIIMGYFVRNATKQRVVHHTPD